MAVTVTIAQTDAADYEKGGSFFNTNNATVFVPRTTPSRVIKSVVARYVFAAFLRTALTNLEPHRILTGSGTLFLPWPRGNPSGRVR